MSSTHIMASSEKSLGAQTVRRAISALKLVAAHPAPGIRLADIADQLGLERPTAHRILKALTEEGMLVQEDKSRRYTLGSLVFELGLSATHQFNLRDMGQPVLSTLAEQTGDTSFLFVRSGNDAVCIARTAGTYPIQTPAVPVGTRQPLGVNAGGLALLSVLSRAEVLNVIAANEHRLSVYGDLDPTQMLDHWERATRLGYALIGNFAAPGVSAVGVPVFNSSGTAVAAISIAAISTRMTETRVLEVLPLLKAGADELKRLLRQ